jgi:hypothetical protein
VQLAITVNLTFRSTACATTFRKRRDIDIDLAANLRGCFDPHTYFDSFGFPRGYQMNLKSEIKLKQDLNQYTDGTIVKAPQGLTTLSNELAENTGITDPFTDLIEPCFRRWKGWMTSNLTSLIILARVFIFVGCCIIPCV